MFSVRSVSGTASEVLLGQLVQQSSVHRAQGWEGELQMAQVPSSFHEAGEWRCEELVRTETDI